MEKEIPICPNCDELRGIQIELQDASYSDNHLECIECGDEFDKPNP